MLGSSDGPFIKTGFSNQSVLLCNYLASKGHEVHYFDHTRVGQTIMPGTELEDGTKFNFKIYGNGTRPYFSDILQTRLKEIKPDFFGVLLDTFMLMDSGFLNQDLSPARSGIWFPSDGGAGLPVYPGRDCSNILRKVNLPVAMSKFGQAQARELHGLNTEYIPHGVDIDLFKRDEQKRNLLRKQWGLDDKFVIGAVFRNQPRKMSDRMFKIMSLVKDRIPNAVLFCHCDPLDPASYFDMGEMIKRYNLQNRIAFSGMNYHKGWDYRKMPDIYQVMDMKLDTTSGEGFGITIAEAMAMEIPQLITDYTTTQELIKDNNCGEGIKLSGTEQVNMFESGQRDYDKRMMNGTIIGSWHVERGIADIYDGAEKIVKLYKDESLRREYGKNGRKAAEKDYNFEVVGKQWENAIKRVVNQ